MFALLCFITAGAVCVYSAEPRPAVEGAEKPRGYSDLVQADASALVKILQKPLAFSYFGPNGQVFGAKKKRENSDVRRLSTKRILIPERMRLKKKKRTDVVYNDFDVNPLSEDIEDGLQNVPRSKNSLARKSDDFEDSSKAILSSKLNGEETDGQRKRFSNGSEGENSSIKNNTNILVSNPNRLNYEETENQKTSVKNGNKDVIDNLQSKPIKVMSEEIEYPGDDYEKIQAIKNYKNSRKIIVPNSYQNKYDEQNPSDKNEDYNYSVIDNLHTQPINVVSDEIEDPGNDLEKTQAIQNSYKIDLKKISNGSNKNQYEADDHGAVYKLKNKVLPELKNKVLPELKNKVLPELKKDGNEDYTGNDDIETFSELQKKLDSDFQNDYVDFNNDAQELSNQHQLKKHNRENLYDNNPNFSSLKKNTHDNNPNFSSLKNNTHDNNLNLFSLKNNTHDNPNFSSFKKNRNDSSNHYDYDDNNQSNDDKLNNTSNNSLKNDDYYNDDELNVSKLNKPINLSLQKNGYSRYDENNDKHLNKNINSSMKKLALNNYGNINAEYGAALKKDDYYYDEDESKLEDNPIEGDTELKQLQPIENLRSFDHNENVQPVENEEIAHSDIKNERESIDDDENFRSVDHNKNVKPVYDENEESAHSHIKNKRECIDDVDCEDLLEESGLQGDGLMKKQLFYKNQADLKKSGVILNDFKDTKLTQDKNIDCGGHIEEIDGFTVQHDDGLKKKHASQADLKKSVLNRNDYKDSNPHDCEDTIEESDEFILQKDDELKNTNKKKNKNQADLVKPRLIQNDDEDSKLTEEEYNYSPTNSKHIDDNYYYSPTTKNHDLRRDNSKLAEEEYNYSPTNSKHIDDNYYYSPTTKNHDLRRDNSKLTEEEYNYSPTNSKHIDDNYYHSPTTKNHDLRRDNSKKYKYKDMKPLNKNKDNNFSRQQTGEREVNDKKFINNTGEDILKLVVENNGNLKSEDSSINIQLGDYDEEKSHFEPQHLNNNEDDANKKQFDEDECPQEEGEDSYNTTELEDKQDALSSSDGDLYKADGFKSIVEKEYKLRRNKESNKKRNKLNMKLLEDQKDELNNYDEQRYHHAGDEINTKQLNLGSNKDANNNEENVNWYDLSSTADNDNFNYKKNVFHKDDEDDVNTFRGGDFERTATDSDSNKDVARNFSGQIILKDTNSKNSAENIPEKYENEGDYTQKVVRIVQADKTIASHRDGEDSSTQSLIREKLIKNKLNLNNNHEGDRENNYTNILKHNQNVNYFSHPKTSDSNTKYRKRLNTLKNGYYKNTPPNTQSDNNRNNLHNFDLNHESGNNRYIFDDENNDSGKTLKTSGLNSNNNRNIFDNENNNSGKNQKTSGLNSNNNRNIFDNENNDSRKTSALNRNNLRKIKHSQQDNFGNPPKTSNINPDYSNNRKKFENSKNANLNNYQKYLERNKDLKKIVPSNISHDSVSVTTNNALPQTDHELVASPELSAQSNNKYNVVSNNPVVVDQKISGSTHKKSKPKNEKYEKGEGKESEEKHATKYEEKGDKGSTGAHKEAKVEHGHHTKEGDSGSYKEDGGDEKKHEDSSGYHGEHKAEDGGEKGASYSEDGEHKKGHSTHGTHNVHKKDEYEKREEFYDESDDEGDFDKAGGFFEESDFEKGGSHKESHHDEADHHDLYGSEKHHEKGDHYADGKAHKEYDGHDVHHDHFNLHKKKGDEVKHKKWSYGGKPGRR